MLEQLTTRRPIEIVTFVVSPLHRYEGRPADGPLPHEGDERPDRIEVREGLGVVGDRYFGRAAHRRAAVTLIDVETVEHVARELGLPEPPDPGLTRRNIVVRGAGADALRDEPFALDSGDGPVLFQGRRPANPCAWMDIVIAPGAFQAMRRRGGVRCEPLSDGELRLGAATLFTR